MIQLLFGLLLAAGVGYTLWLSWNDRTLESITGDLHPLPIAVSFALMLVAVLGTAPMWLTIYRDLGGRVGTLDAYRIFLVTNVGKYLPGKMMHAAGRVALLQAQGQSASIGVTSVVVELALILLGAALVSLLSVPTLLSQQDLAEYVAVVAWLSLLLLPIGLACLHPRILGPVLRFGLRRVPGTPADAGRALPPYRTILLLLLGYVLFWLAMSVGLFATTRGVYALGWEWLPAMSGVVAVSYLFGLAVPIAPAGIGAREGLMTILLSTMMPAPIAAAVSVLYRIVSILAELSAAGLALLLARVRR